MKSISFKLDENKVVNTSAWFVSLIQFANKLNFLDVFRSFSLEMKSVSYINLNRLQTLIAFIIIDYNYINHINEKSAPDIAAAELLWLDITGIRWNQSRNIISMFQLGYLLPNVLNIFVQNLGNQHPS